MSAHDSLHVETLRINEQLAHLWRTMSQYVSPRFTHYRAAPKRRERGAGDLRGAATCAHGRSIVMACHITLKTGFRNTSLESWPQLTTQTSPWKTAPCYDCITPALHNSIYAAQVRRIRRVRQRLVWMPACLSQQMIISQSDRYTSELSYPSFRASEWQVLLISPLSHPVVNPQNTLHLASQHGHALSFWCSVVLSCRVI